MTQTKQAKHTDWETSVLSDGSQWQICEAGGGDWIASCRDEQTAKTIINAANSHQELLGALQTLLAIVHEQGSVVDSKFDNGIAQAQRAIAHATGE